MGLFDFARNIGNKIFGSEDEAPEKIKSHIEDQNPGVSDLQVAVADGVVTLSGEAESAEAMEKAVLMAGNLKGVSEIRAEGLTAPASEIKVEYYEIVSGDTLSAISKKYYGSASKYMRIFEANREVIQDPDKIFVGQKIRIPLD